MTTTTKQVFHPTLRYRDAHAAIDWLERALGFERRTVHEDDEGNVVHAELDFRGGLVMLGSARDPREGGFAEIAPPLGSSSVYVVIDDPDALHDRAVAAGGEIVARARGPRLRLARLRGPRPGGEPLELRDVRPLGGVRVRLRSGAAGVRRSQHRVRH